MLMPGTAQEPANTNLQVREDTVKRILFRARCRQHILHDENTTTSLGRAYARTHGEDMNRGVYVERLSEVTVGSLTEAFQAGHKRSRCPNRHPLCARSFIERPPGTLAWVAATASWCGPRSNREADCAVMPQQGSTHMNERSSRSHAVGHLTHVGSR